MATVSVLSIASIFLGILLIIVTPARAARPPPLCLQCTNFRDGVEYDFCKKNGVDMVQLAKVYKAPCNGACFITQDKKNASVVVRGCTTYQSVPLPLPPKDGCYDWQGVPFCICRDMLCNMQGLGESSGVALDDHLQGDFNNTDIGDQDGPLQCYECISKDAKGKVYTQCPKDHRVNPTLVGRGNCTGACFTRSDPKDFTSVSRGCTSSQYGLPNPLPKDGCYNWNEATFCVCTKHSCNGRPIGTSSGKDLDYHLDAIQDKEDFKEIDGLNRCYQCINYDAKGNYYRQCPKHKRIRNAFLDVCNGTCFTRTYDYDDRKIARGCTESQYGLPNPLPPDGCYKWYSEIWCVCSKTRCNGRALGEAQDIEFDAHIPGVDGAYTLQPIIILLLTSFFLTVISKVE